MQRRRIVFPADFIWGQLGYVAAEVGVPVGGSSCCCCIKDDTVRYLPSMSWLALGFAFVTTPHKKLTRKEEAATATAAAEEAEVNLARVQIDCLSRKSLTIDCTRSIIDSIVHIS